MQRRVSKRHWNKLQTNREIVLRRPQGRNTINNRDKYEQKNSKCPAKTSLTTLK